MKEKKEEKEITHSELNIERWPIFSTLAHTRWQGKSREIIREQQIGEEIVKQKIVIHYVDRIGTLGAAEYKLFQFVVYKLLKQNSKDGIYRFTLRDLIRELTDVEKPGARHYEQVIKSMMRCRSVLIDFENSFRNKRGEIVTFKEPITLFSSLKIFERKKDVIKSDQEYFGFSEIEIHPVIWQSIKEKNIKPLRFDVIKKLNSDVSVLLYKHLDLVMFDKKTYERDIVELAEDVGITEKRTREIRKRLLKAAKELEGKELTSGRIKKIEIVKSETGSGWKIRVEKGKHIKDSEQQQQIDERGYWLNVYNNLSAEEKAEVDKYVDEQMKRFYELTGRDGGDIYRELVIIEYLKEKGGKK